MSWKVTIDKSSCPHSRVKIEESPGFLRSMSETPNPGYGGDNKISDPGAKQSSHLTSELAELRNRVIIIDGEIIKMLENLDI